MQTEARMSALNTGHGGAGAAVDGGTARYAQHLQKRVEQQQQQQQQHEQALNTKAGAVSHLVAGGIAGAASKTCTAPLARLTILFQVQGMHSNVVSLNKPSLLNEASRIMSEEGFRAFWKGNLVTIAHRLPYSSINFYTYEHYKNLLHLLPVLERHKDNVSTDVCIRLLSGGLAGITAASITYPLDLVRTRLAAQTNSVYYKGISHTLYSICKDEGVKGLYKGLGPTLLGVAPNIAISFSVYETLRSHWQIQRPDDSSVLVSLACGSIAGIASSTVTFPLDLVRRRKQLEGAAGRPRVYNSGLMGTFRHIIGTEGFCRLYRGILPEYLKVVPSVSIVFMTYEAVKSFLSHELGGE